ncbi:hypothetical protein KY325_02910 [Candidatus Woesearchaeota archaeon]|nr:hypothetical protein [Candidatus Woesearchaeota archaeon]MBW3018081.1 hypothetical protein [Candidatus Woesearchaeota archaeon]
MGKKRVNRKGQGLPLSVIVILIIAAITLVVIIAIFSRQVHKGEQRLDAITNPIEYKAACLNQNQMGYDECVEFCKTAAEDNRREELCVLVKEKPK